MQTRRQFLFTVIAGCFCSTVSAYSLLPKIDGYSSVANRLATLLTNNDSAVSVGKTYQIFSNITSINLSFEITTLLAYLNLSIRDFLAMNNEKLLQHIKVSIAEDFNNEHIEQVNGWLLSKTEIQLCHVLSLVSQTSLLT